MKPNDMPKWQPWEIENNFAKWLSPTGLYCAIVRHSHLGHLCGYVRAPYSLTKRLMAYGRAGMIHPFKPHRRIKRYMSDYYGISGLECHGGVTGVFHGLPHYRASEGVWIGFDCAHAGDLVPGMKETYDRMKALYPILDGDYETYKDFAFVRQECEELAKQVKFLR